MGATQITAPLILVVVNDVNVYLALTAEQVQLKTFLGPAERFRSNHSINEELYTILSFLLFSLYNFGTYICWIIGRTSLRNQSNCLSRPRFDRALERSGLANGPWQIVLDGLDGRTVLDSLGYRKGGERHGTRHEYRSVPEKFTWRSSLLQPF